MNPYMLMPPKMQDVSGLQPVFQNFGQQQANQQAALAQQNQLVNQAGQTQGGGGMNQLAMAMMLRKGAKKDGTEQNFTVCEAYKIDKHGGNNDGIPVHSASHTTNGGSGYASAPVTQHAPQYPTNNGSADTELPF